MSILPGLDGVIINSSGSKLVGVLYCPDGPGPHPTAILLHGLPGLEKNADLAYALREIGWNALIFHYRGCWGSEGDFTLAGIPDDVQAALDTLTGGEFPVVDVNRIAAVGHSLGGWAAIVTAANRDPRIRAVVTMGGISNLRTMSLPEELTNSHARFLRNITGKGLQSQWRALEWTYNPVDVVNALHPSPLFIVHGTADTLVPVSQAMELKTRAGEEADLMLIEDADHTFSRHRRPLVETVVGWLAKHLA
jgi:dipeptidyl aminopeptidase/acylaminoacyl peptidase